MDSLTEPPMYVKCFCNNCGHSWESASWARKCPECNSENINQDAMIRGL